MKRTPIKRKTPLRTKKRINPMNRARRAKLYKENFGDYADLIRAMPCLACGKRPSEPHHVRTRGAGGKKKELVPLCWHHHQEVGYGTTTFQSKYKIDLAEEAARLWKIHGEDDISTQL